MKHTHTKLILIIFISIFALQSLAWARPRGNPGQTKGAAALTAVWAVRPLSPSQRPLADGEGKSRVARASAPGNEGNINSLRPLAKAEKIQDKPNTPQRNSRVLILLGELRKEFVSALEYQTNILLGATSVYLERNFNLVNVSTALPKPLSEDDPAREAWIRIELHKLTSFAQRIFKLSGRSIAGEDQAAILSLIRELHGPLFTRNVKELKQAYIQKIFPALGRLLAQSKGSALAAASELEQASAAAETDNAIETSLLRPLAVGEGESRVPQGRDEERPRAVGDSKRPESNRITAIRQNHARMEVVDLSTLLEGTALEVTP